MGNMCNCIKSFWTFHNSSFHKLYLLLKLTLSSLSVGPLVWELLNFEVVLVVLFTSTFFVFSSSFAISWLLWLLFSLRCEIFGFFSSHCLKTRGKHISFAQFVYSLREVCLLFNLWMMKFAIGCLNQVDIKRRSLTWYTVRIIAPFSWRWSRIKIFWHNCEFYHWKVNTLSPKNIKTEQS